MSCTMCEAIETVASMIGRIPNNWLAEALTSAIIGECRTLGVDAVVAGLCPSHAKEHKDAHAKTLEARRAAEAASS